MKMHVGSKRFQLDIRFGKVDPVAPAKERVTNTTLTTSLAPKIGRTRRGRQSFGFSPQGYEPTQEPK